MTQTATPRAEPRPAAPGMQALTGNPAFRKNPYPFYEMLRHQQPVFHSPAGFWLLTRYQECLAVLGDDRFGYPRTDAQAAKANETAAGFTSQRDFFFFKNPPDHTRIRAIVRDALSPKVVFGLRPYVQAAADRLLDEALPKGEFDLISAYAHALPFGTICQLLDVPDTDRPDVMRWAQVYLAGIGPTFSVTEEQEVARDGALAELKDYFGTLAAQRRRQPGADLLTALVAANTQERLSGDELLGTCIVLFVAGHSTTTNLIGNGTVALLRNPDQLERFKAEPDLEASAIEEILRYDAPTHMSYRIAFEDVQLGDQLIRKDEEVLIVRGAANRDPAQFPDPHELDLGRRDNKHLTFGTGRHVCVGSALARLQGRVALGTLFRRAPELRMVTDALDYQESMLARGLKTLPVVAG
ncbi:MAG: cytochrome P450 [Mycobacteriales bacterium]